MGQLLSGSIGNPLLESGSIAIGSLVKHIFWNEIGVITSQIVDSGSILIIEVDPHITVLI